MAGSPDEVSRREGQRNRKREKEGGRVNEFLSRFPRSAHAGECPWPKAKFKPHDDVGGHREHTLRDGGVPCRQIMFT